MAEGHVHDLPPKDYNNSRYILTTHNDPLRLNAAAIFDAHEVGALRQFRYGQFRHFPGCRVGQRFLTDNKPHAVHQSQLHRAGYIRREPYVTFRLAQRWENLRNGMSGRVRRCTIRAANCA